MRKAGTIFLALCAVVCLAVLGGAYKDNTGVGSGVKTRPGVGLRYVGEPSIVKGGTAGAATFLYPTGYQPTSIVLGERDPTSKTWAEWAAHDMMIVDISWLTGGTDTYTWADYNGFIDSIRAINPSIVIIGFDRTLVAGNSYKKIEEGRATIAAIDDSLCVDDVNGDPFTPVSAGFRLLDITKPSVISACMDTFVARWNSGPAAGKAGVGVLMDVWNYNANIGTYVGVANDSVDWDDDMLSLASDKGEQIVLRDARFAYIDSLRARMGNAFIIGVNAMEALMDYEYTQRVDLIMVEDFRRHYTAVAGGANVWNSWYYAGTNQPSSLPGNPWRNLLLSSYLPASTSATWRMNDYINQTGDIASRAGDMRGQKMLFFENAIWPKQNEILDLLSDNIYANWGKLTGSYNAGQWREWNTAETNGFSDLDSIGRPTGAYILSSDGREALRRYTKGAVYAHFADWDSSTTDSLAMEWAVYYGTTDTTYSIDGTDYSSKTGSVYRWRNFPPDTTGAFSFAAFTYADTQTSVDFIISYDVQGVGEENSRVQLYPQFKIGAAGNWDSTFTWGPTTPAKSGYITVQTDTTAAEFVAANDTLYYRFKMRDLLLSETALTVARTLVFEREDPGAGPDVTPPDTTSMTFTAANIDSTDTTNIKLDLAAVTDEAALAWWQWKANYDGTWSPAQRWYSGDDRADTTFLTSLADTIYTTLSVSQLDGDSIWVRAKFKDTAQNVSDWKVVDARLFSRTPDTTPPAQPSGLALSPAAASSHYNHSLTWSANTEPDLDHYNIYRLSASPPVKPIGTTTLFAQSATNSFSFDFTQTIAVTDSSFLWQVTAVDASDNESPKSATVWARPYDLVAPPTPVDVYTFAVDSIHVNIYWSEGEYASGYGDTLPNYFRLYRSTESDPAADTLYVDQITGLFYNDTITYGSTYNYAISAVDSSTDRNESDLTAYYGGTAYLVPEIDNFSIASLAASGDTTSFTATAGFNKNMKWAIRHWALNDDIPTASDTSGLTWSGTYPDTLDGQGVLTDDLWPVADADSTILVTVTKATRPDTAGTGYLIDARQSRDGATWTRWVEIADTTDLDIASNWDDTTFTLTASNDSISQFGFSGALRGMWEFRAFGVTSGAIGSATVTDSILFNDATRLTARLYVSDAVPWNTVDTTVVWSGPDTLFKLVAPAAGCTTPDTSSGAITMDAFASDDSILVYIEANKCSNALFSYNIDGGSWSDGDSTANSTTHTDTLVVVGGYNGATLNIRVAVADCDTADCSTGWLTLGSRVMSYSTSAPDTADFNAAEFDTTDPNDVIITFSTTIDNEGFGKFQWKTNGAEYPSTFSDIDGTAGYWASDYEDTLGGMAMFVRDSVATGYSTATLAGDSIKFRVKLKNTDQVVGDWIEPPWASWDTNLVFVRQAYDSTPPDTSGFAYMQTSDATIDTSGRRHVGMTVFHMSTGTTEPSKGRWQIKFVDSGADNGDSLPTSFGDYQGVWTANPHNAASDTVAWSTAASYTVSDSFELMIHPQTLAGDSIYWRVALKDTNENTTGYIEHDGGVLFTRATPAGAGKFDYHQTVTTSADSIAKAGGAADFLRVPVLVSAAIDTAKIKCNVTMRDIQFARGPDGAQPYYHEIQSFTTEADSYRINAWVLIDTLQYDAATTFYMCYGRDEWVGEADSNIFFINGADTVWSDYTLVLHMEEASGTITDASPNAYDSAKISDAAGLSYQQTGQIGYALDFAQSSESDSTCIYWATGTIDSDMTNTLLHTNGFVASFWYNVDDSTRWNTVFDGGTDYDDGANDFGGINMHLRGGNSDWELNTGDGSGNVSTSRTSANVAHTVWRQGVWQHATGIFKGTDTTEPYALTASDAFIGIHNDTALSDLTDNGTGYTLVWDTRFKIGVRGSASSDRNYDGLLDEFRLKIQQGFESTSWWEAEYLAQRAAFCVRGAETAN